TASGPFFMPPGPNPPPPPPGGPNPPKPPLGFCCLSVMAVVTKTLSPTTIGHDHATPGTSAFQATFFFALHSSGSFGSSITPVPSGPRNCGQSPPVPNDAARTRNPPASNTLAVMDVLLTSDRLGRSSPIDDEGAV